MIVKLLTEHHLEFLRFKGGCNTHVKMPHCWKSHHVTAHYGLVEKTDTGQPRYLKVQGNGENTSSYLKFDISKI